MPSEGFGDLRALALSLNLSVHGVACTVTTPTGDPVETRGIWITPASDGFPVGNDIRRTAATRIMALRRDELPAVPRNTLIVAAERDGDTARGWRVEAVQSIEADHVRVVVVLDPTADQVVAQDAEDAE